MSLINNLNALMSYQFRFIQPHNTSDALIEFLDNAYGDLNKAKVLQAIFLDFSTTLDTVDHETLLRKLVFYGFIF